MDGAVAEVLLTELVNQIETHAQYALKFKKQFESLKTELDVMRAYLYESNRDKGKYESVKKTLTALREIIYVADDVVTGCQIRADYQKAKGGACCFPSPQEVIYRWYTGKKLTGINQQIFKMRDLLKTYVGPVNSDLPKSDASSGRNKRWTSNLFDQSEVVGLEADSSKIKKWILPHTESLHRIGIVGMGGLGKTTITQKIFNDPQVKARFQKRIWVCVSQSCNEVEIMRGMLHQLNAKTEDSDKLVMLNRISKLLENNTYLIVMDDVWTIRDGWWDRISKGLPKSREHSGCIIVTSRNEEVVTGMGVDGAQIHKPKSLDQNESWELFCKVAFQSPKEKCKYPDLEEVGREIVQKCQGLPLAIKTIGGLLSSKERKLDTWKRISENFYEKLGAESGSGESVMASLQLSYDELPDHLKQCILCFSIYPDDVEIEVEHLLRWWVGEGFVRSKGEETSMEVAYQCLLELISRCLVEVSRKKDFNGRVYSCRMHDLVQEMIIQNAKEEAFCDFDEGNRHIATKNSRHLGVTKRTTFQSLAGNQKLRALVLTTARRIGFTRHTALAKVRSLRVLDLSGIKLEGMGICEVDLWHWITSLKLLAYLNLQEVENLKEIPQLIHKLWGLQILVLAGCKSLKKLPPSMTTLPRLKVLHVGNCPSLSYLPKGLSKLSTLQELYGFKVPSPTRPEACLFSELKKLSKLQVLQVDITEDSKFQGDDLVALEKLEHLRALSIDAGNCEDKGILGMLDELSLPPCVEQLYLRHFCGETTPAWISPISLPQLLYLCIEDSKDLTHMNDKFWVKDIERRWKVNGLCLKYLQKLKEDWVKLNDALPALRYIEVSHCSSLKSFPCNTEELNTWKNPRQDDEEESWEKEE